MKRGHTSERTPAKDDPDRASDPGFAGVAFQQLRTGLHRFLLARLRKREDVEDLMQEVYLRLVRFADTTTVRFPHAYALRVAFNVLYEFRLHRGRSPVAFDSQTAATAAAQLADESARPDEEYERSEHEGKLRAAIERLPPMQRAVLLMATKQDLSYTEIAAELGIAPSTARVHLYRALRQCRQEMSKE